MISEEIHQPGDEAVDLETWDWMAELGRQERDRMWLSHKTGVGYRSVYRYAAGQAPTPLSFLMAAASVLGIRYVALPSPEGSSDQWNRRSRP